MIEQIKNYKKFFLLALVLIFTNQIKSQSSYDLDRFVNDTKKFISQPTKWELKDWAKFGIVAASTFLVIQYDDNIRNEIKKWEFNRESLPIEIGRIWGEIYTTAIIGGGVALNGLISNNQKDKEIAFEIFQSAIYTGLITQSLKMLLGRARPYNNLGERSFHSLNKFSDDFWALPSGHTSLAFSLSTVLAENSKSTLQKLICYIPALLTAFSRVAQDKHWSSDVLLGAAIGYFVGTWVVNHHEENEIKISNHSRYFAIQIPLN